MHFITPKSILNPENGFNIYRGCTHGCIYCDARSVCYKIDHVFEDIAVKKDAPMLLEATIKRRRSPAMLYTGAMSDPYMPIERELCYTRDCLRAILRCGFGATVLTKSTDVLRDIDLIEEINKRTKSVVQMTLTTHDPALGKIIEPHVSPTESRAEALQRFDARGVPTVVWLSPFLPFLNDTEENLRALLSMCFSAGVKGIICYGIGLTLREGNREYFYTKLDQYFPGLKRKYALRYGNGYEILSEQNTHLMRIFHEECERRGVIHDINQVFSYLRTLEPRDEQLSFL